MQLLTGKTAVVTGGSSGIGLAITKAFVEHGARVWVGDFSPVADTSAELARLGVVERRCDVRNEADVEALIGAAVAATGQLDILVNNAGITLVKGITEVTEQEWDSCLDTNLKGAFFGCKHAIRQMQRQGGGSIVNMASNAGLLPRSHDPVYSISKGALVALTKSLALSHSIDRIRVNAICPGPVGDTRIINAELERSADPDQLARQIIHASPLAAAYGRMISPREIAEAAVYLVSDAAVMVTGTCIAIDGGKSLGVPPRA